MITKKDIKRWIEAGKQGRILIELEKQYKPKKLTK